MISVNRVNPVSGLSPDERRALYLFPEGFSVVSTLLWTVIADGGLTPNAMRVLAYLASKCGRSGRVMETQAVIAERLGLWPQHVSKAMRELQAAHLVLKIRESGRTFLYLDARRLFRGSAKAHEAALERQRRVRERERKANVRELRSAA